MAYQAEMDEEERPSGDHASATAQSDGVATPATDGAGSGQVSFPVVGIGASAGGLEALEAFFGRMPAEPGAAFVIVQHLAPQHPSLMGELLAKVTRMPVVVAEDGMRVEGNRVHVIPHNASLTITGGSLSVRTPIDPHRTPIDAFFRSLAEDQGSNAVCIVLSGTGTDGSLGLKAVKEHGGMAMAQAPEDAKYDSMPRSAISLGLVDHVLPVREMPAKILEYVEYMRDVGARSLPDTSARGTAQVLRSICSVLQRRTGHDFSQYKPATVVRRVQRRAQILQAPSLEAYFEILQREASEIDLLFRDLLIGVTQFFRDPDVFKTLATLVLPELFRGKGADEQVRVWVPGCASGEEAYSIAILLREMLPRLDFAPQIKIFATDIDDQALETARVGRYPEGIVENLSPERIERYFIKQGAVYQVDRQIREMCVFSVHNLLRDPPFSRLDMVSCRNLLIYLESDVQRRLVPLFHYALRPGGHLVLGPSESLAAYPELFHTLDKKHRIFRRNDAVASPALSFPILEATRGLRPAATIAQPPAAAREQGLGKVFERLLLDRYTPAAVIINERAEVIYASGRTGKYLELPSGLANVNVIAMARESLRPSLHTAIHEALKRRQETVQQDILIEMDGLLQRLNLTVRPIPELEPEPGLFLVVFGEVGPPVPKERADAAARGNEADPLALALEIELRSTRQHLQTTIEELESSNEELQSANEEMLSTNEELQSTNEELQTSKEELQSINEELQTVNLELNRKVDELDRANNDLQNLFASTDIATIFLDKDLRIKKFSAAATAALRIIETDIGRPITDISAALADPDMLPDVKEVLATLIPKERQVCRGDADAWYIRRVRPYRSADNGFDGVVVTFVDVTELKRAQQRAAGLAAIVESSQDAIVGMSLDGTITAWNAGAERLYGYSLDEAIGRPIGMLASADGAIERFLGTIKAGRRSGPHEIVQIGKSGRRIEVQISLSPVVDAAGDVVGAASISQDIGDRKRVEAALKEADKRKNEFLAVLGHELRNPLVPIRNAAHLLQKRGDPTTARSVLMIERQVAQMTRLIDDLLDVTRIANGKVVLRKERLDLVQLARSVVEDWQSKAADLRVTLSAKLPGEPLNAVCDPARITQALGNLVQNGVKFTPAGGRVTVEAERGPEATAILRVIDTGVGIDSVTLSRLFEPFSQGAPGVARGGLGLGLWLAKSMVALHGGELSAESDGPHRGATFTIRLPLSVETSDVAPVSPAPGQGRALRILLVEDNLEVAESMTDTLEFAGHTVSVAHDAAEGIAKARKEGPEVVLCDIGLPGDLNGHDVARALRADPATASLYCVALSGFGQESDRQLALDAGFDAHLIKPVDPDALERFLAGLPVASGAR